MKMKYVIKSWIPAEEEEPEIYMTLPEAMADKDELEGMQPENRYEIDTINEED